MRATPRGRCAWRSGSTVFWILSLPSATVRRARLEAALSLPWTPSSVIGIRARAKAYHLLGMLKLPTDSDVAKGLMLKRRVLFQEIGDEAGVAACIRDHGGASIRSGDPETGRRDAAAAAFYATKRADDALGAAWCYRGLGAAALALGGSTLQASSYFLTSLSQSESLDDPLGACHAQVALASALRHEGKCRVPGTDRYALRYQRDYPFTSRERRYPRRSRGHRGRSKSLSNWPRGCAERLRAGQSQHHRYRGPRCPKH